MKKEERLNTEEAAQYLGYAAGTLENWRIRKIGPAYYKPAGKIFYLKRDLDLWMKKK